MTNLAASLARSNSSCPRPTRTSKKSSLKASAWGEGKRGERGREELVPGFQVMVGGVCGWVWYSRGQRWEKQGGWQV
jgi:hypothetical protein